MKMMTISVEQYEAMEQVIEARGNLIAASDDLIVSLKKKVEVLESMVKNLEEMNTLYKKSLEEVRDQLMVMRREFND